MANIADKYYVRRGEQQFAKISSLFGGVRILKIDGMTNVGSTKNIYTASWVNSQTEDYMVAGDSIVRENVDIDITFIVSNKYGATNVRQQHDAFVAYMTDGELYIKSDYIGRVLRCVCLKDYKPTTVHIGRSGDVSDYMIGTIQLHTLDNRAGDNDGYIENPYPSSGGSTPTPPAQQVSTTNVYDAALGATQASLNQRFENKDGEFETALSGKVDKVQGKGLSSNDYTNEEKTKLAGLSNYDDTQVRRLITQTNAKFSNYYNKSEIDDALSNKQQKISDLDTIRSGAQAGSTAVQPETLDSYVNGGRYNEQTERIELLHDNTVVAYINTSDFIANEMIDDVVVENGYLVISFNTTSGIKDVSIGISPIFDPSSYYTKQQVDDIVDADTLHPITQQEFNEIFN